MADHMNRRSAAAGGTEASTEESRDRRRPAGMTEGVSYV
jgi:hypothetical protein